jgi:tryptophan synthase alpha chain
VGFGVSQAQDVSFIGKHADIAVIGTAALMAWENGKEAGLRGFFEQLLD